MAGWYGNAMPRCCQCLLLGFALASAASAQIIDEYQVKAAFLYNFAKFVEWPALTFKTDKDPVRICVLGQDPFGSALGDAVGGKTVLGRHFALSNISSAEQVTDCQILFISSSERKRLRSIFAELRTTGILTVGETEGFAAEGGIVNFKLADGRVHLEINVEAAGQAKLRINSSVLSLAQIVKTGPQK
jgi:hypothetical protein